MSNIPTTYYLLKDLPGYLLWLAHTVQHWVIIQITPALWVITASSSCTLATSHDQNCFNVGPMYPTLAQQQHSIGPTSLTVSVPGSMVQATIGVTTTRPSHGML